MAGSLCQGQARHPLHFGNLIQRPFVAVPWTTPPFVGQSLVSGGDWRAAVWGACSIGLAMAIYYPFARAAERQRLEAETSGGTEADV